MRFRYVLSEVMVGLWRNVTMTIAMIITMGVSLTLLGASLLLYQQVDRMRDAYSKDVEVSMFFQVPEDSAAAIPTPEQREAIEAELRSDPMVAEYRFEDQQEAYRKFSLLFASSTPDLVALTPPESMPQSFQVKLSNPDSFDQFYEKYRKYISDEGGLDLIRDQKALLEKVFNVLASLQQLALIISVVQGVAALMLVINTIQIAAYSKRREVAVMKLVGASNWFIQAPFVLEAVAAGLMGAVIAYGTLVLGKIYIFDGALAPLAQVITEVPWTNVHLMFPILAFAGAAVSSITGWFALRFYIKV